MKPVIHTGHIKGAKPPENMFPTQQHPSLVLFIHNRICGLQQGPAGGSGDGAGGDATGAAGAGGAGGLGLDLLPAVSLKLISTTKAEGEVTSDLLVWCFSTLCCCGQPRRTSVAPPALENASSCSSSGSSLAATSARPGSSAALPAGELPPPGCVTMTTLVSISQIYFPDK